MSPWMSSETRPDPNRERCVCGEPWEEHYHDHWPTTDTDRCTEPNCGVRTCPNSSGQSFRPESDEDRIADRAGAMEGGL